MEERLNILSSLLIRLLKYSDSTREGDYILLVSVIDWWTIVFGDMSLLSSYQRGYDVIVSLTDEERKSVMKLTVEYEESLSHLDKSKKSRVAEKEIKEAIKRKYGRKS